MKFNYQIRTKEGEIQTGIVEASSKEAALNLLQKYGVYVTYLKEARPPFYAKRVKIFERVSKRDLVLFSRQLAIMFGSKVSLVESLRTLANQTEKSEFREIIFDLSEEVEGGSTFSKALSRHPKIFPQFYIAMIKAGEASGKMADSLNYLAEHLESEYHLRGRIRGALIYPFLVLLVVIITLAMMMFFVIPNLNEVIAASGAEMPKITKMILALTGFLKKFWLLLILGIFIAFFLIFRYYKTESGKNFFDKVFLKLPIIGPLLKTIYLSRFAENFSILIAGGLMISQALELTANTIGNLLYKEAILKTRDEVRKGVSISSTLELFPEIFPPVFIQMALVGEKTGTLDTSLINIAKFYQRETDRELANLLSILEPALVIFLGVIVGGLVLAVLIPLYQVISV